MHATTLFALSTLFAVAFAAPGGNTGATCSTGPVQCCNTVQKASDPAAAGILGGLGVVLQDPNVLVGLSCDPVTVIGGSVTGQCNSNAVCCKDNSFGSAISVGCVPVSL